MSNTMLYPLIFDPVFKHRIWGGRRLERFGLLLPDGIIGEAWDISCRRGEMGIVSNGELAGTAFSDCIEQFGGMLMGEDFTAREFGLLVKLIDANDDLSIQVHPGDSYARRIEGVPFGKSEMWCILDCPPNAELWAGLKRGVTKESFEQAVKSGVVLDSIASIKIKTGNIINIPPGLVHAVSSGVIALEIQQNSDVTYRIFDYGRAENGKPRGLHIEKALEVIDYDAECSINTSDGLAAETEYFSVWRHIVCGSLAMESDKRRYQLITCVSGECLIKYGGSGMNLHCGRTALLPASLGDFLIRGNCEILITIPKDNIK